jgi:HAD superfamily hydrolase (TIGR01459 family)
LSSLPVVSSPVISNPVISSLAGLADRYRVIFSDVWGVVHNGLTPHSEAGEALTRFRAGGGTVIMISNAPRPHWSVKEQLDLIGVVPTAYDAIVTSGDVTHGLALAQPGRRCLHIGADRDEPLFRDLPVERVALEKASFVICSGLADDDNETAEDYRDLLVRIHDRGLPMICANPDLVVERGHQLIPCAGAIAALYEAMGGKVIQAGKPYRPIYEATLAKAAAVLGRIPPKAGILAIGDAIRTDVIGAVSFGIDSLFLTAGIHAGELHGTDGGIDRSRLDAFLAAQAATPTMTARALGW